MKMFYAALEKLNKQKNDSKRSGGIGIYFQETISFLDRWNLIETQRSLSRSFCNSCGTLLKQSADKKLVSVRASVFRL